MPRKWILIIGLGALAVSLASASSFAWLSARAESEGRSITAGNVEISLKSEFSLVDKAGAAIGDTTFEKAVFMPSILYNDDDGKSYPGAKYVMKYKFKNNSSKDAVGLINIAGLELSQTPGAAENSITVNGAAFRLYRLKEDFFRQALDPLNKMRYYLDSPKLSATPTATPVPNAESNPLYDTDRYFFNSLVFKGDSNAAAITGYEFGTIPSVEDIGFRLETEVANSAGVRVASGTGDISASAVSLNGISFNGLPSSRCIYVYMPKDGWLDLTFILYTLSEDEYNPSSDDSLNLLNDLYRLCGVTPDVSDGATGAPSVVVYATQPIEEAYQAMFPFSSDFGTIQSLFPTPTPDPN
jgi:predicted ribosomally synthesized peptide with SipW-like signal peptide